MQKGEFAEAEPLLAKAIKLDEQNYPHWQWPSFACGRTHPKQFFVSCSNIDFVDDRQSEPAASAWASRAAIENRLGDLRSAKASPGSPTEPSSIPL